MNQRLKQFNYHTFKCFLETCLLFFTFGLGGEGSPLRLYLRVSRKRESAAGRDKRQTQKRLGKKDRWTTDTEMGWKNRFERDSQTNRVREQTQRVQPKEQKGTDADWIGWRQVRKCRSNFFFFFLVMGRYNEAKSEDTTKRHFCYTNFSLNIYSTFCFCFVLLFVNSPRLMHFDSISWEPANISWDEFLILESAWPICIPTIWLECFKVYANQLLLSNGNTWTHIIACKLLILDWTTWVLSWPTVAEGDPLASFSIATTPTCWGGCYTFFWIAPLILDPYLIILAVKQRGINHPLFSLWYGSTWYWTPVSLTISEHSKHYANGPVNS